MIRRVHVHRLKIGSIALVPAEAHHVRDVLRLTVGTTLELFDDDGHVAAATVTSGSFANVVVQVAEITKPTIAGMQIIIAAAIPKGDRAEWMIEKLAELGVTRFIPLAAERSVVLPAGRNKIERWERIAIESAKQSRRVGVMTIAELTPLAEAIQTVKVGWYLSTAESATPIVRALADRPATSAHTMFIGPEGGWAPSEIERMNTAGLTQVGLTSTVLRVETAAVAAASVVLCLRTSNH